MNKFLLKKYIAIVACLLGSFAIISFSAIVSHNFTMAGQTANFASSSQSRPSGGGAPDDEESESTDGTSRNILPDFNMLILGLDDGILPDAIMLLMYDGENNMIDVVSVPRDTRVILTPEERQMFTDFGRRYPSHHWLKINELNSWGGMENGHRLIARHLELTLDIDIHFYTILEMEIVKDIVDAVDGIYMDIRPQGFHYNPRDAQGRPAGTIIVNIPGGRQLLDGNRAEQVLRFRQFQDGDIGRIHTQQQFMREFFNQALTAEAIMSNPGTFVNAFATRVRTDFGVLDIARYIGAVDALNPDSIEFHTLPGHADFMRDPAGVNRSWFFVDVMQARELMEEIREGNIAAASSITLP